MLGTLIALLLTYAAFWTLFRLLNPSEADKSLTRRYNRARTHRLGQQDLVTFRNKRADAAGPGRFDGPNSFEE